MFTHNLYPFLTDPDEDCTLAAEIWIFYFILNFELWEIFIQSHLESSSIVTLNNYFIKSFKNIECVTTKLNSSVV